MRYWRAVLPGLALYGIGLLLGGAAILLGIQGPAAIVATLSQVTGWFAVLACGGLLAGSLFAIAITRDKTGQRLDELLGRDDWFFRRSARASVKGLGLLTLGALGLLGILVLWTWLSGNDQGVRALTIVAARLMDGGVLITFASIAASAILSLAIKRKSESKR